MSDNYMIQELSELLDGSSDPNEVIDVAIDIATELDMNWNGKMAGLMQEAIMKLKNFYDKKSLPYEFLKRDDFELEDGVNQEIGRFLVEKIKNKKFDEINRVRDFEGFGKEVWDVETMHPILSRIYDEFIEWRENKGENRKIHEDIMAILASCLIKE